MRRPASRLLVIRLFLALLDLDGVGGFTGDNLDFGGSDGLGAVNSDYDPWESQSLLDTPSRRTGQRIRHPMKRLYENSLHARAFHLELRVLHHKRPDIVTQTISRKVALPTSDHPSTNGYSVCKRLTLTEVFCLTSFCNDSVKLLSNYYSALIRMVHADQDRLTC